MAGLEHRVDTRSSAIDQAIARYESEEVTLFDAAQIAGLPLPEFYEEVVKRGIPLHYNAADYEQDVQTLEKLRHI